MALPCHCEQIIVRALSTPASPPDRPRERTSVTRSEPIFEIFAHHRRPGNTMQDCIGLPGRRPGRLSCTSEQPPRSQRLRLLPHDNSSPDSSGHQDTPASPTRKTKRSSSSSPCERRLRRDTLSQHCSEPFCVQPVLLFRTIAWPRQDSGRHRDHRSNNPQGRTSLLLRAVSTTRQHSDAPREQPSVTRTGPIFQISAHRLPPCNTTQD